MKKYSDRIVRNVSVITEEKLEYKFDGDIPKINPKVFIRMLEHLLIYT